jgi:hypothetical protein
MRAAATAAVCVAGCNQIYGLTETHSRDAFEPPVVRCFSDDFADGMIDTTRWTDIGNNVPPTFREQDGEMQAPIAMGQIGFNGLVSTPFDIVNGTLTTRLRPGYLPGFTELDFFLDASALGKFWVVIAANEMYVASSVNNYMEGVHIMPYSSDLAYVRFRHDGDAKSMHIETSPDAATWTIRQSRYLPYSPSGAQVTLLAGSWASNGVRVPEDSVIGYGPIQVVAPGCTP